MRYDITIIFRDVEKSPLKATQIHNYEFAGGFCLLVLDSKKTLAFPADKIEVVEITIRDDE